MTRRVRRRSAAAVALLLVLAGLVAVLAAPAAAQPDAPRPTPPTPTPSPEEPAPAPTGAPSPNPQPGGPRPTPPPAGDDDDPAWWDLGGQTREAIEDFFRNAVDDAINPVLQSMAEMVLTTPDLTGNPQVRTVWNTSLVIANTILVLFIVAAGFVVASRETLQAQYGLKELAPRIVIAGIAPNLSLLLTGEAIEFANALSVAVAGQGVDPGTAARALTDIWLNVTEGEGDFLAVVLVLALVVMAIIVMLTFMVRVAILTVLIGIAPLALLFHALPQTEGLAFLWWRALGGCFAIQLGQTAVLIAAVRVFLTPTGPSTLGAPSTGDGWLGVLVGIAMMWLLVKIPSWVRHYLFLNTRGRGILGQVIHAWVMLKTLGVAAGLNRRTRTTTGRRASGPSGDHAPTTPTSPPPLPPRQPVTPRQPTPSVPDRRRAPMFSHAPRPHQPTPTPGSATAMAGFSDAPGPHQPMPPRAGAGALVFSHPPQPHVPTEGVPERVPPVRFSHAPAPSRPYPAAATSGPVRFSHATPPAATPPARNPSVVARPVFSSPPTRQVPNPPTRQAGSRPPTPTRSAPRPAANMAPSPRPARAGTTTTPPAKAPPAPPGTSPPPATPPVPQQPASRPRPSSSRNRGKSR